MTQAPLVSVIVTCHNQANVIVNTISSVLRQTYDNWECIVVNDGSSDNSESLIEEISRSDSRVKLISQDNQGVSFSRNLGFASSSGEFIQFLDGDDLLHPEKIELQVAHFLDDDSIDVSYTNHCHYFAEDKRHVTFESETLDAYPLRQFLSGWHAGVSLPVHAPIYRRTIWREDELPYPEDYRERCEDWVFLVLVAAKSVKFAFFDKVLCTYVINTENFTRHVGNWCVAEIQGAQYLEDKIPLEFQKGFVAGVIERSIDRYLEARKPEILRASRNWQLGNTITKPFFVASKYIMTAFRSK